MTAVGCTWLHGNLLNQLIHRKSSMSALVCKQQLMPEPERRTVFGIGIGPRIRRITPTAPPSSTTGARIWRRSVRLRGALRSSEVLRQLPDRIRVSISFCRLFATRQRVFKEEWHHSRIYLEAVKMAFRVMQPYS